MKSIKLLILLAIILLSQVSTRRSRKSILRRNKSSSSNVKAQTTDDQPYCSNLKTVVKNFVEGLTKSYINTTLQVKGSLTNSSTTKGNVDYTILLKINSFTIGSTPTCSSDCESTETKNYKIKYSDLNMNITGYWKISYTESSATKIRSGTTTYTSSTNMVEILKKIDSRGAAAITPTFTASITAASLSGCTTEFSSNAALGTSLQTDLLSALSSSSTTLSAQLATWWTALNLTV
jgi:hypothetical protein